MEASCLALLCAVLSVCSVHHVMAAENLTVGIIPNKPWSYEVAGKSMGLAVKILETVFDQDKLKDNGVDFSMIEKGKVADLIKDVSEKKNDVVIGAAGVIETDAIRAEAKLVRSNPFLKYGVSMVMKDSNDAKSIQDAINKNMTITMVKGPVFELFKKCTTLGKGDAEKATCEAVKKMFDDDNTLFAKDTKAAIELVDDDAIWLTDGGSALYEKNSGCNLKVVEGGVFKTDVCKYIFLINKDKKDYKTEIDAGLKASADAIKKMATDYLETTPKADNKKTCGTSAISYTLATILLSAIVSKFL